MERQDIVGDSVAVLAGLLRVGETLHKNSFASKV